MPKHAQAPSSGGPAEADTWQTGGQSRAAYCITRQTHVPISALRQRPEPGSPDTRRRQCCTGCGWELWTRQMDSES